MEKACKVQMKMVLKPKLRSHSNLKVWAAKDAEPSARERTYIKTGKQAMGSIQHLGGTCA